MKTRLLGLLAFVVAGGCAAQSVDLPISPQQSALIKATCQQVMHIGYHNSVDLAACTSSLTDSLVAKMQGEITWKGDQACAERGLARGSSEFSMCVLDKQREYTAQMSATAANAANLDTAVAHISYDAKTDGSEEYYDASFDTKRRREGYSCAQLALEPGSNAFGQCVADLDASLFNADHPNP